MTFKGFNIAYPEYEVITPQGNQSYTLRSLNVAEEEKLKGSLITPSKIADHLNTCLFEAIVTKPDNIKSFDDFLRNVTLKDRDALLFGLYHITYEEIRNYEISCSECDKEYEVTVKASETFSFSGYTGKNILTDHASVKLPVSKGVIAVIKQPTLFDEITAAKTIGHRPGTTLDIMTETLIIDRFTQDVEASKEATVYKEREDIIDAYMSLPAKDKRAIYQKYDDSFGQYGIELKMQSVCSTCGHEQDYIIDLVDSFFRALYSAR